MTTHGLFHICPQGFAHWACPDLMTPIEANALADREYPTAHVLPYWQAKKMQDPDTMSEPALRKSLGLPVRSSGPALVITGKVDGMTRPKATAYAQSLGWRVVSTVSASVALVVYGEGGGRKANDARRLGIPIAPWRSLTSPVK